MEDFLNFLAEWLVPYMLGISFGLGIGLDALKKERKKQAKLEKENKELKRKNYRLQDKRYEDEKHIEFLHTAVDVEYKKLDDEVW